MTRHKFLYQKWLQGRNPAAILFLAVLLGCDITNPGLTADSYVLEGYLVVGRTDFELLVSKVVSLDEVAAGMRNVRSPVSGARCFLFFGSDTLELVEDTSLIPNTIPPRSERGTYRIQQSDSFMVQPNTLYRIEAIVNGQVIRARTNTPGPFSAQVSDSTSGVTYPDSPPILSVKTSSSFNGLLLVTKIDYSQPINFAYGGYNYFYAPDSVVPIPWKYFLTLGSARIYVYAFDSNYGAYVKSRRAGNPTTSLFEPTTSVENGFGVFGSASLDSVDIVVGTK